jgi:O-antigen/teichoic acid export membrane protein
VTADSLDSHDQDSEDFLARTLPLPAIDIAGFEAPPAAGYIDAGTRQAGPTSGLPGSAGPAAPPGPATAASPPAPPAPSGRPGLRGVARGGVINLAGAVISAAATVGLTVVVTRNFAKSVVGTFFVAISLFLIVEAVTNLGAYNGTIYFIARVRALHAERRIPAIIRATVLPVVIFSLVGAATLIAFVSPLARLLLAGHIAEPVRPADLASALRVLAMALPFAAIADTMLGATRGFQQMHPTVLVDRVGRSTLQLLGVAAAAAAGASALLAPLWALPYVPAAIVSALWLRRIMRQSQASPPASRSGTAEPGMAAADGFRADNRHGKPNARGFWQFTAPRSIASVAQIVIQRLDIVLVGVMRGPAEAAIYTAATRFLVAGQLGNSAISMAAQPQLTHLFAVRDRAGANTVYQVTTAWLILLTWPIYLLAAVFGPSVLAIFGRSYHAGSTVMVILALAMLVATACGQVDTVLITAGKSSWSLANGLLAMCVNIGVDLVLIPKLGITGAAIGWAAAIGVSNLAPLVQVATAIRVHPFGRAMVAACALTALSFAAIPLGLRAVAGGRPATSIAAVAVGLAVMVLGLRRLHGTLHLSAMPGLNRLARNTARYGPYGKKGSQVE